ncbi:MAG TPA: polyphosphate polymerase domain-containing protein [Bacteroidia bacterium]|nr:polyphosphate polymerase domain-containing protein [Bacteroidia bacterium]
MTAAKTILLDFDPITLKDMDAVALMNRTDVKFAFSRERLPEFLKQLTKHYYVLDVNGHRISRYESLYFDTIKFDLYFSHHRKKPSRYKIRFRKYVESNLHFFEVKFKNNKGRTIKDRVKQQEIDGKIENVAEDLLKEKTPISVNDLEAKFWVNYSRITLVNKYAAERVTIDLNLTFKNEEQEKEIDDIVIAEVKQDKEVSSKFLEIMKHNRIRKVSLSKYCFGVISLYNSLKHNNFKKNLRLIKKTIDVTITSAE